jgi:formiminotetrahydrofolate cyclodeaminase
MTDRPYSTFALADFADALASGEPAPAGGSAAAAAAAMGVSLLIMVTALPKTRTGAPEEVADLAQAAARLRPLRDRLLELVDEDSAAYTAVVAAYRRPRGTDDEKAARAVAIGEAMRGATEVPMNGMRACQQALRGAGVVAGAGLASAAGDVAVGVELLGAALRGLGLSVDINLRSVADQEYVARVTRERQLLAADAAADEASAFASLTPSTSAWPPRSDPRR